MNLFINFLVGFSCLFSGIMLGIALSRVRSTSSFIFGSRAKPEIFRNIPVAREYIRMMPVPEERVSAAIVLYSATRASYDLDRALEHAKDILANGNVSLDFENLHAPPAKLHFIAGRDKR